MFAWRISKALCQWSSDQPPKCLGGVLVERQARKASALRLSRWSRRERCSAKGDDDPDSFLDSCREGSPEGRPRHRISPVDPLVSTVDGNNVASKSLCCFCKSAVTTKPPSPPEYNVEVGKQPSRGDVCTAEILQVLCGALCLSNFVFGGMGVGVDLLGIMGSDNKLVDVDMFYLQYCFRQPSEFHIFLEQMSRSLLRRQAVRSCVSRCTGLMWIIF